MNYRRFIRGRRFNFWVLADWAALGVTNQSTFISWVEANSDYTVDSVTDFSLVGTELKCNIFASGGSELVLAVQGITEVKAIGNGFDGLTFISLKGNNILFFNLILPLPNSLSELYLGDNNLTNFNPNLPLPSSLSMLGLGGNNLTNFNPNLPLPSSLSLLDLGDNNISDWSLLEPWINAQPAFTNPCEIYTALNPTSAIGTAFETIALTKNATIVE